MGTLVSGDELLYLKNDPFSTHILFYIVLVNQKAFEVQLHFLLNSPFFAVR